MKKEYTIDEIRTWIRNVRNKGLNPNKLIIPAKIGQIIKIGNRNYGIGVRNSKIVTFDGVEVWSDDYLPENIAYLVDSSQAIIIDIEEDVL